MLYNSIFPKCVHTIYGLQAINIQRIPYTFYQYSLAKT